MSGLPAIFFGGGGGNRVCVIVGRSSVRLLMHLPSPLQGSMGIAA